MQEACAVKGRRPARTSTAALVDAVLEAGRKSSVSGTITGGGGARTGGMSMVAPPAPSHASCVVAWTCAAMLLQRPPAAAEAAAPPPRALTAPRGDAIG